MTTAVGLQGRYINDEVRLYKWMAPDAIIQTTGGPMTSNEWALAEAARINRSPGRLARVVYNQSGAVSVMANRFQFYKNRKAHADIKPTDRRCNP